MACAVIGDHDHDHRHYTIAAWLAGTFEHRKIGRSEVPDSRNAQTVWFRTWLIALVQLEIPIPES